MELALAQLQNPSGLPWGAHSLEVDGVVVCTFSTTPAWVSATEVSVMSTANTAGQRPPTAVARRRLISRTNRIGIRRPQDVMCAVDLYRPRAGGSSNPARTGRADQ